MQTNQYAPFTWLISLLTAMQWPVIVLAAFALGKSVSKLEGRVLKAEKNVADLVERHMPHIHAALLEIKTMLQGWRK